MPRYQEKVGRNESDVSIHVSRVQREVVCVCVHRDGRIPETIHFSGEMYLRDRDGELILVLVLALFDNDRKCIAEESAHEGVQILVDDGVDDLRELLVEVQGSSPRTQRPENAIGEADVV